MTSKNELDDAIRFLRQDQLDADRIQEISEAVWKRIDSERLGEEARTLRSCHDFQSLIPAYISGRLRGPRTLLLKEHTAECPACRRCLLQARPQKLVQAGPMPERDRTGIWMKWVAAAAAVLVGFGIFQLVSFQKFFPWGTNAVALLQDSKGVVFQVLDEGTFSLEVDQKIGQGQSVRTARGSGALLRLSDGSKLEMAERTELAIFEGWFGTTVRLRHGHLILEAAAQGARSLSVLTDDCRVGVKGTVFSVSHGIKGSRVSVIEGEVLVEKGDVKTALKPGDQFTSQLSLARVPIEEDIAWSQRAERHLALLEEFSVIQEDLHQATFGPELRYSSCLLDLLPEGTVLYGAVPNVSRQLVDAYHLFIRRVQENAVLGEWYEARFFSADQVVRLDEIVETLTVFGDSLGQEIVLAAVLDSQGELIPILVAEVADEVALRRQVKEEVERMNALDESGVILSIIDDPSAAGPTEGLFIVINGSLLSVSPSLELLESVLNVTPSSFRETRFYQRIIDCYSEGVDWLFSMDLERLGQNRSGDAVPGELEGLGLTRLHDFMLQRRKNEQGIAENRMILTFEEAGKAGVISWIADPGPIGGMEFVSPDAHLVMAFAVENAAGIVESLMRCFPEIEQFDSTQGLEFFDDIAAALGGEIVFAMDGPVLPKPAWKLILEVYEPERLQGGIECLVEEFNRIATHKGGEGIELMMESSGAMTVYSLRNCDSDTTVEYAYFEGYMIIVPERSLIHSAVRSREAQYTLLNSPGFMESLPRDSSVNLSAVFYQNFAPVFSDLISNRAAGRLSPSIEDSLRELFGEAKPALVTMSTQPGQVTLASGADLESFWFQLGMLQNLGGWEGIGEILENSPRSP